MLFACALFYIFHCMFRSSADIKCMYAHFPRIAKIVHGTI